MTIETIQQDFFERCDDGLPKYRRLAETMAHLIESGC